MEHEWQFLVETGSCGLPHLKFKHYWRCEFFKPLKEVLSWNWVNVEKNLKSVDMLGVSLWLLSRWKRDKFEQSFSLNRQKNVQNVLNFNSNHINLWAFYSWHNHRSSQFISIKKNWNNFPHFLRVRKGDKNIFLLFMTNGKVRKRGKGAI